jgi:hypothetical protein
MAHSNDREFSQMKIRILSIVLGLFGLTAFSPAQDTGIADLDAWLCTSAVAQDPQTKQALKIRVGSASPEDVRGLLGKPWRVNNDADCDATQYSVVWEYLGQDASGAFFRIHVAFDKDGKVSLVARIPRGGKTLVLAYAADKEHQH